MRASDQAGRAKDGYQQAEDDEEGRVGQVGVPGVRDIRTGSVRMRQCEPVGNLMRGDPARNGEGESE